MSIQSHPKIPQWVQQRILGFFNRARNVSMIVDGPIRDSNPDGKGKTIGPTLAARILRERNALPRRRFMRFDQLDDIRGVGQGTIDDLVFSFGESADAAFRSSMYSSGTIFTGNWPLEFFRFALAAETFAEVTDSSEGLRQFVGEKVRETAVERELEQGDRQAMLTEIENAYPDVYTNSTPEAAYAFALWFYRFDADNWFSWERIQEQTIPYFEHNINTDDWEMKLYLFKGVVNRGIVPPGIAAADLPVVVNHAEQSITFWISALYD